jgi:dihydroneopterin aldolase
MDIIFIRRLEAETVIGVNAWERQVKQRLRLDLELGADIARAAASDALDDALDYNAVAERTRMLLADSAFQLVETLAEHLAARLQEEFNIPWLRITVHKPGAVPGAESVGAVIERGNR